MITNIVGVTESVEDQVNQPGDLSRWPNRGFNAPAPFANSMDTVDLP
jgi:hypothetical protein